MSHSPKASRLWWLTPGLALLLGLLAWGRLGWEAMTNVRPPWPLAIEGVAPKDQAPWFRCHSHGGVQDGAALWIDWQCGLGPDGRAHLVRFDLENLQIQRRWPLPEPFANPLRIGLWGLLPDGADRLLLVEASMPSSSRRRGTLP